MLKTFIVGASLISSQAFSADTAQWPSKCVLLANQQLTGSSLYIDADGKTVITEPKNIVKRNLENGVETITVKVTQPKNLGYGIGKFELETVEKTVALTRDKSGKLLALSTKLDTAAQLAAYQKSGLKNAPVYKSLDSYFSHSGDNCHLDQRISIAQQGKAKDEKQIVYDKKFCDSIAPMIKKMGSQNAAECGALITSAQAQFDMRNEELAKEGKALFQYNYFSQAQPKGRDYGSLFNISTAIQSCSIPDIHLFGNVGTGAWGMPLGMMYGTPFDSGLSVTAPPEANKSGNSR